MKIIDADTHISPYKQLPGSIRFEELIERMDFAGVDQALTWIQPPYQKDLDDSLAYLYQGTKKYPERLIGFGWADPRLGLEKAIDTVKKCINEYGFHGVKLNGAQNEYYIDDPELAMPVIEEIAKTGKPIAFHIGADAYEFTHPFRLGKIAERFPELSILMVHMGGAAFADLSSACIETAMKYPNITLIGSAIRDISILKGIQKLGCERICFGSDTPFALMNASVAMYQAIMKWEKLTPENQEKIMSTNIRRALAIT